MIPDAGTSEVTIGFHLFDIDFKRVSGFSAVNMDWACDRIRGRSVRKPVCRKNISIGSQSIGIREQNLQSFTGIHFERRGKGSNSGPILCRFPFRHAHYSKTTNPKQKGNPKSQIPNKDQI